MMPPGPSEFSRSRPADFSHGDKNRMNRGVVRSSISCTLSEGMMAQTSQKRLHLPPWPPLRPTVMAPNSLAVSSAAKHWENHHGADGESHVARRYESLKLFRKIRSYPKSLAQALIN